MKLIKHESHNGERTITLMGRGLNLTMTKHAASTNDVSVTLLVDNKKYCEAHSWRIPDVDVNVPEAVADLMRITSEWSWDCSDIIDGLVPFVLNEHYSEQFKAKQFIKFYDLEVIGFDL